MRKTPYCAFNFTLCYGEILNTDMKQLKKDKWITSDRPFADYPIGTKARACGGGYWIKNERGWKWCTGATFPRPGGDWDGMVSLP